MNLESKAMREITIDLNHVRIENCASGRIVYDVYGRHWPLDSYAYETLVKANRHYRESGEYMSSYSSRNIIKMMICVNTELKSPILQVEIKNEGKIKSNKKLLLV